MQPDNPPPAPPPTVPSGNGKPEYDFIFNPKQQQKRSPLPLPGGKKGRIILVGALVTVLIVVGSIIAGVINNAGKADTVALIAAAKQQQELIRVSKIGIDKAKTQAAKNIAVTTLLALESEQDDMQAAIKTAGLNPKQVLTGSADAKTTQLLTTAEQNNRFDEAFLELMTSSLTSYQKSVKTAYDSASGTKLRAALSAQYKSANTLAGVAAGSE